MNAQIGPFSLPLKKATKSKGKKPKRGKKAICFFLAFGFFPLVFGFLSPLWLFSSTRKTGLLKLESFQFLVESETGKMYVRNSESSWPKFTLEPRKSALSLNDIPFSKPLKVLQNSPTQGPSQNPPMGHIGVILEKPYLNTRD